MSIAGIAKEVTTISISAWFFGDILTPLNIVGVAITTSGMSDIMIWRMQSFSSTVNVWPSLSCAIAALSRHCNFHTP